MRLTLLLPAALLLCTAPAFALKTLHTRATHAHAQHAAVRAGIHATSRKSTHPAMAAATHHEPAITMPADRATAIQTALIQRGYLSGEPSGSWDASTAAAMEKLQSDNGWQTRVTPDARALIKLGLGPNSDATPPQ